MTDIRDSGRICSNLHASSRLSSVLAQWWDYVKARSGFNRAYPEEVRRFIGSENLDILDNEKSQKNVGYSGSSHAVTEILELQHYITADGVMGHVRNLQCKVETGDVIWAAKGALDPWVIRPLGVAASSQTFRLVGQCKLIIPGYDKT